MKILPSRDIPMLVEARERKKGFIPILEVLIFFAVLIVASTVQSLPTTIVSTGRLLSDSTFMAKVMELLQAGDIAGYVSLITESILSDQPAWMHIVTLFSTVLCTVIVILFCRVIQKRRPSSMGLNRKGAVPEYLKGALIGAVMISATVLLCVVFGGVKLSLSKFNIWLVLLFFVGYMFQGMSEEVLCRGYLMVSITRRNQVWRAVLVSSLVFSLLHIMNPGYGVLPFVNILLCGAVFGVYALKRNDLWGACAMHSLWNFFQGNIFGISVSGTGRGEGDSILSSAVREGASDLVTGGKFGIEGSICCTVVMVAALALVLFVMKPAKGLVSFPAPEEAVPAEE